MSLQKKEFSLLDYQRKKVQIHIALRHQLHSTFFNIKERFIDLNKLNLVKLTYGSKCLGSSKFYLKLTFALKVVKRDA